MERVLECHASSRKKVVYILAKQRSQAYQWTSVPTKYNRSKCFSFYHFLYGSDVDYRTVQKTQQQGSGPLTILQDNTAFYIIVTDEGYNNREILATGQPTKLTRDMIEAMARPQPSDPKNRRELTVTTARPRQSNHKNRRELMAKAMASSGVLSTYHNLKYLASGTVGEVFSMERNGQQFVGKLQLLPTLDQFTQEVEMQQRFAELGLGPELVNHQIFTVGRHQVGLIVMPLVQTLDHYLHTKKTHTQLGAVVDGLIALVTDILHAKITHGDLALFNMYWQKNKVGAMDFDRASAEVFAPEVDILRVATELTPTTRSKGGKTINPFNSQFLATRGLAKYMAAFGLRGKPAQLDRDWNDAYDVYCKQANVLCL